MPKSRVSRKKLFREFSKIDKKFIQENNLKNIRLMYEDAKENHGLNRPEVDFMMFVYDLEFFTIQYVAKNMGRSALQMQRKIIFPLQNRDLLYKHFNKLTPTTSVQDAFFRDETKYNYRVRYALTQRARLIVARLYRKMRGEEPFKVSWIDAQRP